MERDSASDDGHGTDVDVVAQCRRAVAVPEPQSPDALLAGDENDGTSRYGAGTSRSRDTNGSGGQLSWMHRRPSAAHPLGVKAPKESDRCRREDAVLAETLYETNSKFEEVGTALMSMADKHAGNALLDMESTMLNTLPKDSALSRKIMYVMEHR